MRALLLHPDRDFDPRLLLQERYRRDPEPEWHQQLLPHERDLVQDLELDTLLAAMAGGDQFLLGVVRKVLLSAFQNDASVVAYRQQALRDSLNNPEAIRNLYALAVDAIDMSRKHAWGLSTHYPSSLLYESLELLESLSAMLRQLRVMAASHAARFFSAAFTSLFVLLLKELDDAYLSTITTDLKDLKFRRGVLFSAELGPWNESDNYVLRFVGDKDPTWWQRIFGQRLPGLTFRIHERDEAGARILGNMRQRAISRVALALAESADHVLRFFKTLRTELAFYVACLNLHDRLLAKGEPVVLPVPDPPGTRTLSFRGLYDACLTLHKETRLVGNDTVADSKNLLVVTGANQGGKSSFLRSIGLAQVMMQAGMFVGAEAFRAELCSVLLTHYKREEDTTMTSGKLDEELARMSSLAERLRPYSILLFNESFAATNEREGSEIARQVVTALLEKRIKILYVTHLYDFARGFLPRQDALFFRPERLADGTRTFRLLEAEPLETSFGEDLYRETFENRETEQIQPAPNLST